MRRVFYSMWVSILFFAFVLLWSDNSKLFAQGEVKKEEKKEMVSGKFERKSLSIIPITAMEVSRYSDNLFSGVSNMPLSARFDYNTLQSSDIKKFESAFRVSGFDNKDPLGKKSTDAIANALSSSVLEPAVTMVCSQDSIEARFKRQQKRVVASAAASEKVTAPTSDESLVLVNGGFIPVLLLTAVESKEGSASSKGIVYWYRIDASKVDWVEKGRDWLPKDFKDVKLTFISAKEISGFGVVTKTDDKKDQTVMGSLSKEASKATKESPEDAKLAADAKSVKALAKSIIKVAYTMDEFKIRGVVQQVDPKFTLDVGKREDAYLDQGYKIYETRIGADKQPYSVYTGFIRIDNLADNNDKYEDSRAFSIISSGIEQGNIAVSHDQGLDAYLRPSFRTLNIPKAIGNIISNAGNLYTDDVTSSINIDAGFYYNIAKLTNINQLFIGLNASFGIPNASATSTFDGTSQSTFQADLSILKKLWLSRFNVYAEVLFGVNSFNLNGTFTNSDTWKISSGLAYGAGVNAGLEYAVNPDLNIGLQAGYKYVLPATKVTYQRNDGEPTEYLKENNAPLWSRSDLDNLNLGGINLGLKISYSLPPLF